MRTVRLSQSFREEFPRLLAQGARFGPSVIASKRDLVIRTIEQFLVHYPRRPVDPVLGICAYPVAKTPFVLLYDYDDTELRVHLIIHGGADRSLIDLSSIIW